jgi:4-amino-4-deoxy-L-arabinose transferase-like glycosyltransferase
MTPASPNTRIRRDRLIITAITAACLLPFIGKAFHIDDPLFLWTAQHILKEPFNFYHFPVNWGGHAVSVSAVTKNPPLASYLLALTGLLFGWKEEILHAVFILPAIITGLGAYELARRWCSRPLVAVLTGILTPVFIVSGTTLMCDMLMLAFWVWAVEFWMRGMAASSNKHFFISAMLCAAAALSKYFGMALIPLLIVYTVASRRRIGSSLAWLLVPVTILAGYQALTLSLYGRGLLFDAASYATQIGAFGRDRVSDRLITGLSFTGGCLLTVTLAGWSMNPRIKTLAAGLSLPVVLYLLFRLIPDLNPFHQIAGESLTVILFLQLSVFVAAGAAIAYYIITGISRRPSAEDLLLWLWLGGTIFFAAFVNWSCNGRSLLPLAPAAGIFLVRRFERTNVKSPGLPSRRVISAMGASALFSLLIAGADYSHAGSARAAAASFTEHATGVTGATWFEGHWGFQYYMENSGAKPLEQAGSELVAGDRVIIPMNNTGLIRLPEAAAPRTGMLSFPVLPYASCMSHGLAGFYSDVWGPLPYVFGDGFSENYAVLTIRFPVRLGP